MTDAQKAAVNAVYDAHNPAKEDYTASAGAALAKSDLTVLRCIEKAAPVPAEWASYRATLRDIVSGRHAGPLPSEPAYQA